MKNAPDRRSQTTWANHAWPSIAQLAALRAFHTGFDSHAAVKAYIAEALGEGRSARGVLGQIRRTLIAQATQRHRPDLQPTLRRAGLDRSLSARQLQRSIDALEQSAVPQPSVADEIAGWFSARVARVLAAHSIHTLADLTVRIPRLRGWWRSVPGLGATSARRIEEFFADHPSLTERARALVRFDQEDLIPWERLRVPDQVNGSRGAFRAPRRSCVLSANNDYEAVQTWLALQESAVTQRAYRKEAERLILWAILEKGKALSSLTTEDAVAYRAFIRQPTPRRRWVGPAAPRTSPQWRPFQGPLSARSAAYALSVISALFRWLIEQRYVLANPFAGVRIKTARTDTAPGSRVFTDHEWSLIRPIANRLEDNGWSIAAAQRLRFVLNFAYGTGLRSSELVKARLRHVSEDGRGNRWITVVGKGNKAGRVSVPPHSRLALNHFLAARGISTSPTQWTASTPLVGRIANDETGLTGARLWAVMKRFFDHAGLQLEPVNAAVAEKLRHASPHWMRHTHATHALSNGASLTTVRDNLRHASVSTTSVYLHTDEQRRAAELSAVFGSDDKRRPRARSRRRRRLKQKARGGHLGDVRG